MLIPIFVSCPKSLENLLMVELEQLGLQNAKNSPQGVTGDATLECIYQIALWSRLANRLHLVLFTHTAYDTKTLYQACEQFTWQDVFNVDQSFKVQFHGTSAQLRNEMYAGQVVKDAIADQFRKISGARPIVDKQAANVQIHAYLKYDKVTLSVDLVGYSLHQRGYRLEQVAAPLKENLAAALLIRSNWQQICAQEGGFADIMCGSGTLVIEAAMIASNMAPGLLRNDQAFGFWNKHQPALWEQLKDQAQAAQVRPVSKFYASDIDARAIHKARENAKRAGVYHLINWAQKELSSQHDLCNIKPGLLVTNPPYGERLGHHLELVPCYQSIGKTLAEQFQDWRASIFTSDPMLAKSIGLRSHKSYAFFNGALACQLYCITVNQDNHLKQTTLSSNAQMLANRVQKNLQHLQKWAQRNNIECYRVYDADLPEYAFAIDKYGDYYVLGEYLPPKQIPEHVAANRRLDMLNVIINSCAISSDKLIIKQRHNQKEQQYQKNDNQKNHIIVREGDAQFYLNLHDYLDTGLFLDHRLLRLEFNNLRPMTRFLNLFCYTGTASVHAALAGAYTTNVDLSNTYLDWATENFRLNKIGPHKHTFIQADVSDWLKNSRETYDCIYMDAPSFSNSKRMKGTLDIQRDHVFLIRAALKRLHPSGKLYFSTHLRSFQLDAAVYEFADVKNISKRTQDEDFKRDQKIHQCFVINHQALAPAV